MNLFTTPKSICKYLIGIMYLCFLQYQSRNSRCEIGFIILRPCVNGGYRDREVFYVMTKPNKNDYNFGYGHNDSDNYKKDMQIWEARKYQTIYADPPWQQK